MQHIQSFTSEISYGYFVQEAGLLLVDTGMVRSPEDFLRHCRMSGVSADAITLILITHEHGDHMLGLDCIRSVTKAPVLCQKNTSPFLSTGQSACARRRRPKSGESLYARMPFVLPKLAPDLVFDGSFDLAAYGINGKVLSTPGHSRGAASVVLESGDAIVGDLIMPADASEHAMAPARFADDEAQLLNSCRMLRALASRFYSGHAKRPCLRDEWDAAIEILVETQEAGVPSEQ